MSRFRGGTREDRVCEGSGAVLGFLPAETSVPAPQNLYRSMKFYLKWSMLILGPFALIVAAFIWWRMTAPPSYSRDELDSDYNKQQVRRLQLERAEKERLDEEWREKQRVRGK